MGLGTIFILSPTVGWAMPLLWPALLATAGTLGYGLLTDSSNDAILKGDLNAQLARTRSVRLPLDSVCRDIVAEEVGREQVLRFTKDKVVVVFKRDLRGKFAVEVVGDDSMTYTQLEALGMEFAATLVQQFAYHRMAEQMERKGATVVGEEVNEEGDIVLKMRRWD